MAPRSDLRRRIPPECSPEWWCSPSMPESNSTGCSSNSHRLIIIFPCKIWKQRLEQMGESIEDKLLRNVTHVLAMNSEALLEKIGRERLSRFNGSVLVYQWLEDSLSSGEKPSEAPYILTLDPEGRSSGNKFPKVSSMTGSEINSSNMATSTKKVRTSFEEPKTATTNITKDDSNVVVHEESDTKNDSSDSSARSSPVTNRPATPKAITKTDEILDSASSYSPPDQNSDITEIFGKLMNMYRALGDDRRSFSYYKAIAVIEKLPFKIVSADHVKHLPAIGKSLQDHIQEIVNT